MNVYIGFDSAWTGNTPGAAALFTEDELGLQFTPPWAQDFTTAVKCFRKHTQSAVLSVIAIDQPTIVMNPTGCRPVEQAVRRVIGRLGGAVQPANTGNMKMFGPEAPIWKFCDQLSFTQKPTVSRPQAGQYLVEVYPCLNIVGLFTYFYQRQYRGQTHRFGEVARYNPERATFQLADWEALCECVSQYGATHQINGLSTWAKAHASVRNPRTAKPSKYHQMRWMRFYAPSWDTPGRKELLMGMISPSVTLRQAIW